MHLFKVKGDISVTLGKKNKLEIELPDDMSDADLVRAIRLHGKKGLMVQVGDPQADITDYGVNVPDRGRVVGTIGPGGVVESVKTEGDGQVELEDVKGDAGYSCKKCTWILNEDDAVCPNCNEPRDVEDELDFDDPDEDGSEKSQEPAGDDGEGSDEPSEPEDGDGEGDGHSELQDSADERKQVEEYILERRPHFDDIPYDFPTLLERKKNGDTWLQISATLKVPSSQLQTKWAEYKKRVKTQMVG